MKNILIAESIIFCIFGVLSILIKEWILIDIVAIAICVSNICISIYNSLRQ